MQVLLDTIILIIFILLALFVSNYHYFISS